MSPHIFLTPPSGGPLRPPFFPAPPHRRYSLLLRSFLRGRFGGPLLFGSGTGERVPHAVISFVAGVLKYRPHTRRQGQHCGPGPCPRRFIVDGEFVVDSVRGQAREPFSHFHVLAGSSVRALVVIG